MRLTNEQIEYSIKSLSKRDNEVLAVQARTIKSYLSEILSLRKELEVSNSIQQAYRGKSEKLSEYIKQLEQDAERGESGVNSI